MYDPIHDRYTSVAASENEEAGKSSSSPPPQSALSYDDTIDKGKQLDSSYTENHPIRGDRNNENYDRTPSAGPERKRKREDGGSSPYTGETFAPALRHPISEDIDGKIEPLVDAPSPQVLHQSGSNEHQQHHRPQAEDSERKRLNRYEGERDRARRREGQAKEIRAGAFARRELVKHDDDDRQPPPESLNHRRSSFHRRSPPHYKYRDHPPPTQLFPEPKFDDPDPERLPEPPKSPPRKFKRPGAAARFTQAEKEAIQKEQEEREKERERQAADDLNSRGVEEVVRSHYNAVPERGKEWRRTDSKIRGLRSFNNWVKSTLIQKFAANDDYSSRQRYGPGLRVLDIGCGKGGDLLKWKSAPQSVDLYVGIDTADISIRQAKDRFVKMVEDEKRRNRGRRSVDNFHAEFFVLDCWSESIDDVQVISEVGVDLNVGPREGWPRGGVDRWGGGGFDVVSLMFCMHYAFESEEKIRGMLRNVSGALRRGGRFIGTIPSSDVIYSSIQSHGPEFGNSLYKVSFPKTASARELPTDGTWRPAWGWKYQFFLEESVEDVPEYVVPWAAFRALALEYGLKLEYKRLFEEIWADEKEDRVLGPLSERMNVKKRDGSGKLQVDGEEWEACKIYMGFCFKKT